MPIYAYRCSSCGHAEDTLQKMSDSPLTICPACQQPTYVKQVTAAGFQLKGSGWYVTDFRNNNSGGAKPAAKDAAGGQDAAAPAKSETAPEAAASTTPAAPAAPAPATPAA